MKRAMVTALMVLAASTAWATTPGEIRSGLVAEGTKIELPGMIVTSVLNSSFTATALPAGPGQAIWVMTSPGPLVAEGDVLDLVGVYSEYKEITTIFAHGWTIVGQVEVPQLYATAAELMSDPEAWESCVLQVTDGLIVNEILPDGDWVVVSFEDGVTNVRLDPYWYDPSDVELGQCYNNATGMFIFHEGAYCLKVFPDGLALTDCTVDAAPISFGAVKSLYR